MDDPVPPLTGFDYAVIGTTLGVHVVCIIAIYQERMGWAAVFLGFGVLLTYLYCRLSKSH